MKTLTAKIFPVTLLLLLASCATVQTVTYPELLKIAEPNLHNTLITISYYCGSGDGYDYFSVQAPFHGEYRYRVSQSQAPVRNRFPLTNDRKKWEPIEQRSFVPVPLPLNPILVPPLENSPLLR